jgi:hypothetical protein
MNFEKLLRISVAGQRRALAHKRLNRPHIFVISLQKTGTQSVYFALRDGFGADAQTFHAHTFDMTEIDPISWETKFRGAETDMLDKWVRRTRGEVHLLRSLADVRLKKTIVTIKRDPVSRLYSALFHARRKAIEQCFHRKTGTLRVEELGEALKQTLAERVVDTVDYCERVFAPLGIAPEAVEHPFSITQVRPDLEVVSLRFDALAEDFARVAAHLGRPDIELPHVNAAHDRPIGEAASVEFEKELYAVFKRDYQLPEEALRAITTRDIPLPLAKAPHDSGP